MTDGIGRKNIHTIIIPNFSSEINKYFTIRQMPVVSSTYWNMVHGSCPEDVMQDKEGLQTMRNLGRNMAWLIKCITAGKNVGIDIPEAETATKTSFIR